LSIEHDLWNINDEYNVIMNNNTFLSYNQIINNIKYSNIINIDLTKIRIKDSKLKMNNLNVKLVNQIQNSQFDSIIHHCQIQQYIDGLNKYFKCRSLLQNINHDMEKSKIKIKTPMGYINCSLIFGSILLHLNDTEMTISQLSNILKINEDEVTKRINSLIKYNIVLKNNQTYKYSPPYGDVDCELIEEDKEDNIVVIEKFTDIIMTIQSRIIKEVKPNKMNIMELERRVQEFIGDSYVKNIFYDCVDSLKKRFYIKEIDSIIEYIV
jgi:predicted transcriptional regulator